MKHRGEEKALSVHEFYSNLRSYLERCEGKCSFCVETEEGKLDDAQVFAPTQLKCKLFPNFLAQPPPTLLGLAFHVVEL